MKLADQLAAAKGEKSLSKAPILRRLMLRSAVFGILGALMLIPALIVQLNELASVISHSDARVITLTRVAAGGLIATSMAFGWMLVRAFLLSRARAASDFSATLLLLKKLKVALATLVGAQVLTWITLIAVGKSLFGDDFAAIEMWQSIAGIVVTSIWLSECISAEAEVRSLWEQRSEFERVAGHPVAAPVVDA